MSRASKVRDAVIAALNEQITNLGAEAFIVPDYEREELESGPKVAVRFGSRTTSANQGPDERDIVIEVCVIGLLPPRGDDDYRAATVAAVDSFDDLTESIIALWTPSGVLARCGMADHRFTDIDQDSAFDPEQLHSHGIWVSMVSLTFQDTIDD